MLVSVGPTAVDIKTAEMLPVFRMGVRGLPIDNYMQQWLGTIIIHINLFHISVPSYDALFLKKYVYRSIYSSCMENEKYE
jgi:hypothetical protein